MGESTVAAARPRRHWAASPTRFVVVPLLVLVAGLLAATPASAAAVPGAPTNVSVMPWELSGKVSFTAPAANGAAIDAYAYQEGPGGPFTTPFPNAASSPFWINVDRLGTYQISIKAHNAVGWGPASAAFEFVPYNTGARFVPTTPTRVYDSRTPGEQLGGRMSGAGVGATKKRGVSVAAGRDVDSGAVLPGQAHLVPLGAVAVALNVTAIGTAGDGFLAASGVVPNPPTTSAINWSGPTTIANGLQTAINTQQYVTLAAGGGGSADVAIDVLGYYLPTGDPAGIGAGGAYSSLATPLRAVDTRNTGGPLAVGGNRVIDLNSIGAGLIPANATAVTYNLTVPNPITTGYLDIEPASSIQVHASSINWTKASDEIIANASIVKLDASAPNIADRHKVRVFSGMGANTNFIIDVTGYYLPSTGAPSEQVFFPLRTPQRIVDTRSSAPSPGKIITGTNRVLSVTRAYNDAGQVVDLFVIPPSSTSVAINTTVADTIGPGVLSVAPSAVVVAPATSTINWASTGTLRANAITSGTTLGLSDQRNIRVFASGGAWTHLIIDMYGYYDQKPAGPPQFG